MVDLPEGTTFESKTNDTCAFNVAGPKSRELLQRLSNADLSNAAWPFLRSGHLTIAGVECAALRVSFTGDLGWEIYCDVGDQLAVYTALIDAAAELGGGPVGSRALMSLRVEKGYGSWSREYSLEYWPQEVGLERLCKMDKEFLNKSAAAEVMQNEPRENLVLIHIDEDAVTASNADARGRADFQRWGWHWPRDFGGLWVFRWHVAGAWIRENASAGDRVQVMILGKPHDGKILAEPPFDPKGERLRG